ncbi:hypothetical protein ACD591_06345 [Rufibacter glacialis]|uniref:Uncharacterized protein n=1 Tax=Rufibacter glacialis TaxID=1259555 RepID=A0A5M8QDL8_9BACT|nr:hypothetical protein [Rufibacter glacialis]KAA6433278.1 hypothetical protein FOE74_12395 [Rufibacter glacialis]
MRFRTLAFFSFLCLALLFSEAGAQVPATENKVVQDFMRYLASQQGRHNRIDKNMLPWKLSEVYLNDSLWAKVNISDESRLAARQGLHGAGPQLKMDYRLTKPEFERLKSRIRQQPRTQWTETDFPDSTVVVQELNLAPITYYAYSYPVVLPSKNLVLVKKYFRSEKLMGRWSCIEVYRIIKPGKYQLENCYLRTYDQGVSRF